jgi:hypothetical protein
MPDRKPEPWESGAAAPFLWVETARGNVEVWALDEDRFAVRAANVGLSPGLSRLRAALSRSKIALALTDTTYVLYSPHATFVSSL